MVFAYRNPIVLLAWLALLVGATREVSTATPLEKVVGLLKKLSAQLTEEGKKEAAEYDKYACFCKEQADEKIYATETSQKKLDVMEAKIEELNDDINTLNGEITDAGKKIGDLENDIKKANDKRADEFAKYEKDAKMVGDAISACERAIEAMKDSKEDIDGNSKVDLVQLTKTSPLLTASLLAAGVKQEPAGFEYQSNDIIATLESLLVKFKQNKVELDTSEFDAKSAHEMKDQAMSNQKKFAEKEKAEKEQRQEALSETLAETKEDQSEETKAKKADEAFIKVLTAECEQKAKDWDQRSSTRADEITAITEALTDLEKNAVGNYKVNKKLTDLQTKQQVSKVAAPSFLQLRASPGKASLLAKASGASRAQATQRVLDLLMAKMEKSKSPVLSSITMKLMLLQQGGQGIDHFVKVRTLIKDLVKKLEGDAKAEANTKAYCDKNMKKQVEARDTAQLTIEAKAGAISAKTAEQAETEQAIAALQEGIAANKKALLEAQELRAEEKARNDESLKMSDAGKKSVEFALQVLKEFYNKKKLFLVQEDSKYVPPNSDRDGNTVGDLAPKTSFEGKYHGNNQAKTGILGILEVIAADFARTGKQVEADEKESQDKFEELVKDNEENTKEKEKEKGEKEKKVADLKDELVQLKDDKKEAEKNLESAQTTLEDLKKMCVAGEETYEERVAKREEEIAALKEAMEILENWKS